MFQENKKGFTLIEMIGVLAIIAILVSAVAPRIFESISDSKVTTVGTFVKTLRSSISKYYADMGTVMPLTDVNSNTAVIDNGGSAINANASAAQIRNALESSLIKRKAASQTGGKWANFTGPYIEKFERNNPPIGTFMSLYTTTANNNGAAAAANSYRNFDLNNDGTYDLPNNEEIVVLFLDEVTDKQWNKIDNMLDSKSTGLTDDQRKARGKVKLNGDQLYIFINE